MNVLETSNGLPLKKVVWAEDGWILRTSPNSYGREVVAFHRHKYSSGMHGARECQLNTISFPTWVCRVCNRKAPDSLQALFVMMNWENKDDI